MHAIKYWNWERPGNKANSQAIWLVISTVGFPCYNCRPSLKSMHW